MCLTTQGIASRACSSNLPLKQRCPEWMCAGPPMNHKAIMSEMKALRPPLPKMTVHSPGICSAGLRLFPLFSLPSQLLHANPDNESARQPRYIFAWKTEPYQPGEISKDNLVCNAAKV